MDGPDSRTDNYSIIFRALLQPQFASKRPLLSHMDITGRQNWRTGIHPSRPFAAVVAKGSFGSRRAEGFPPTLSVNLYNRKSHVLSAACVPCRNIGDGVSNQPGSQ